jgi:vacuolar-type H+-ATPase subunit I/STV1
MAELGIIGLASNIICFVQFGFNLVSAIGLVRDSVHGTTSEIREFELIVEDVQRLNAEVSRQKSSGQKLSDDEERILTMVNECDNVAIEIRKMIKSLKIRHDARSKTLESSRVVIQGLWKRADIDRLRNRLENLDHRIRTNVKNTLDG